MSEFELTVFHITQVTAGCVGLMSVWLGLALQSEKATLGIPLYVASRSALYSSVLAAYTGCVEALAVAMFVGVVGGTWNVITVPILLLLIWIGTFRWGSLGRSDWQERNHHVGARPKIVWRAAGAYIVGMGGLGVILLSGVLGFQAPLVYFTVLAIPNYNPFARWGKWMTSGLIGLHPKWSGTILVVFGVVLAGSLLVINPTTWFRI